VRGESRGLAGQRLLRARKERRTCGTRLTQCPSTAASRRSSMIFGPLRKDYNPISPWWAHRPIIRMAVDRSAGRRWSRPGPHHVRGRHGQGQTPVGVAMPGQSRPCVGWAAVSVKAQNVLTEKSTITNWGLQGLQDLLTPWWPTALRASSAVNLPRPVFFEAMAPARLGAVFGSGDLQPAIGAFPARVGFEAALLARLGVAGLNPGQFNCLAQRPANLFSNLRQELHPPVLRHAPASARR